MRKSWPDLKWLKIFVRRYCDWILYEWNQVNSKELSLNKTKKALFCYSRIRSYCTILEIHMLKWRIQIVIEFLQPLWSWHLSVSLMSIKLPGFGNNLKSVTIKTFEQMTVSWWWQEWEFGFSLLSLKNMTILGFLKSYIKRFTILSIYHWDRWYDCSKAQGVIVSNFWIYGFQMKWQFCLLFVCVCLCVCYILWQHIAV